MDDLISRRAAIETLRAYFVDNFDYYIEDTKWIDEVLGTVPTAQPEEDWTLCSKRLPEDTEPVNITWVNREPESYYEDIKDVPFTATGHYCKGKWYWYSVTCQDYLDEYGECEVDAVDNMIEVIAWKPLPDPYRGGDSK